MREIKFRAWIIPGNYMTEVLGFEIMNKELWVPCKDDVEGNTCCIPSGDAELMQYTGLKDKNGKEIYEGDILNIAGTSWEIIFSFCMFKVSDGFVTQALTEAVCPAKPEAEVIGNIWENPELLEDR